MVIYEHGCSSIIYRCCFGRQTSSRNTKCSKWELISSHNNYKKNLRPIPFRNWIQIPLQFSDKKSWPKSLSCFWMPSEFHYIIKIQSQFGIWNSIQIPFLGFAFRSRLNKMKITQPDPVYNFETESQSHFCDLLSDFMKIPW